MTSNETPIDRRPVRARSRDQFRLDLIEAARQLFLDRGIQATSMADLGRVLGVSKPTVYEAFESKQALVDAVFFGAAEEIELSWIMDAMKSPPPFVEFLDQMAGYFKDFLRSPRRSEVFQLVLREGMHSNDMFGTFNRHLAGPYRIATRKIAAIAMERGECAELPLDVVQRMIVAPLHFLMVDRAISGNDALTTDAALAYVDHSFAALKMHLCGIRSTLTIEPRNGQEQSLPATGKVEAA